MNKILHLFIHHSSCGSKPIFGTHLSLVQIVFLTCAINGNKVFLRGKQSVSSKGTMCFTYGYCCETH